MKSFEQEIKTYFNFKKFDYKDNSDEYHLLDFLCKGFTKEEGKERDLYLEVKEKRQKYNTVNWDMIPEEEEPFSFIMDDLSARKILAYAPFSGLLVRNNLSSKYYWFSVLDMFLMPKTRVNRPIKKQNKLSYKGKWIMDFRDAKECQTLDEVFLVIKKHIEGRKKNYLSIKECYGDYTKEFIGKQGIKRVSGYWDKDVRETR